MKGGPFRLLVAGPLLLVAAASARAQSDPRLVAAVRLAQDGLSDSARAVAARILATLQPRDSLYPEALYTVGLLAATERERRLELRRVVVDFAQSDWADDALLQLAQLDYAAGNPAGTVRQIDQLLNDYPGSPLSALAAYWGARAANDRRDPAAGCRLAQAGLASAGADVELRNQLEFQRQRCQGLGAMAAESVRADSLARARADSLAKAKPSGARRPPAPERQLAGYYVQVSAVKDQPSADVELARIKRAGYAAIIHKEGGYLKVRAGRFASRSEAQAALAELRAKLGGRPFLVRFP